MTYNICSLESFLTPFGQFGQDNSYQRKHSMNQNYTIINKSNKNLQKLLSMGSSAKQRSSVFTITEANKKIGYSFNSRKSKLNIAKPYMKNKFNDLTEKDIKHHV